MAGNRFDQLLAGGQITRLGTELSGNQSNGQGKGGERGLNSHG